MFLRSIRKVKYLFILLEQENPEECRITFFNNLTHFSLADIIKQLFKRNKLKSVTPSLTLKNCLVELNYNSLPMLCQYKIIHTFVRGNFWTARFLHSTFMKSKCHKCKVVHWNWAEAFVRCLKPTLLLVTGFFQQLFSRNYISLPLSLWKTNFYD